MSRDQMTDVFPISFDFKQGEEATSEKLTGFVKQVDAAFSDATQGIGDPWNTQAHTGDLSFEKLTQTSLARFAGSSDWISKMGGPFEDSVDVGYVILAAGRNSWSLGYPLVKATRAVTPTDTDSSAITPCTWGTDITVAIDTYNCLTDRKTSPDEVIEDGDFYVDFYKGTIQCYRSTATYIRLEFNDVSLLPAGAPWATHNVIPTWNTTSSLCTVALVAPGQYTLTLPTMSYGPRLGSMGRNLNDNEVLWQRHSPGWGEQYKLPDAWSGFIGQELPEGSILLWDESTGRVIPQVTFTMTSSSVLTLTTPVGWLTEGSNYRVIVTGSSLSDQVSYLMTAERYNTHSGVETTAGFSYSIPLRHSDLEERFTDDLSDIADLTSTSSGSAATLERLRWTFRESSYPTNPHPQYLHRYGWMENDRYGNTGNAMRGDLVIAGSSTDGDYSLDLTSIIFDKSYQIYWASIPSSSSTIRPRMGLIGGYADSTWTSEGSTGPAHRLGFGLKDMGAIPQDSYTSEKYGALAINGVNGAPLYLSAQGSGPTNSEKLRGAAIGFDLNNQREMNYLKLLDPNRSLTFEKEHLPAHVDQTTWSSRNPCMPSLEYPIAAEQVRELRFKSCPYVSDATNTTESLGGSTTRAGASSITEFQYYFNGPGMIGADFFGVYGNAIFFSNTGDGKACSFTNLVGKSWLDNPSPSTPWVDFHATGQFNGQMPTGLYFHPESSYIANDSMYVFSLKDSGFNASSPYSQPLWFGDRSGFEYASNLGGNVRLSTRVEDGETVGGAIYIASGDTVKGTFDVLIETGSDQTDKIFIAADDRITISAGDLLNINSATDISISASDDIQITAADVTDFTSSSFNVDATTSIALDSDNLLSIQADDDITVFSTGAEVILTSVSSSTRLYLSSTTGSYLRSLTTLTISSSHTVEINSPEVSICTDSGDLYLGRDSASCDVFLQVTSTGTAAHNLQVESSGRLILTPAV